MGSRRNLPPPFPLFGQQQNAALSDGSDDFGFDAIDGHLMHTTPTQQFALFPPLPNTADIERRGADNGFGTLGGGSAFTTPVMAGQMPQRRQQQQQQQHHYTEIEHTDRIQQSADDAHTPLRVGQRKQSLDMEYQPLGYMDSTLSPPLPPELDGDGLYVSGYSTPISGAARGGNSTERDVEPVDEDFVQNVIQEGELERLTRMAVEETSVVWKQEIMGELRTQTNSLADDDWMFK